MKLNASPLRNSDVKGIHAKLIIQPRASVIERGPVGKCRVFSSVSTDSTD